MTPYASHAVTSASVLHLQHDHVDLPYHCNMSLFRVSGLPSFKEHIFQETPFSMCDMDSNT